MKEDNKTLSGDDLLIYGFKRIIEELQKIQNQNRQQIEILEKLEKIENSCFMLSGEILKTNKLLSDLYNMETLTEIAVMEIKKNTEKGTADNGRKNV